jgi:ABC-2 type transport system ATP-binding protein
MNPILRLEAASVERRGNLVVQRVGLTVTQGSWFGVIGANGSGKTSLLRALAGRLPFAAGQCLIDGSDIVDDRGARAERFGFAPPVDSLPDDLRVREVFELVGGDVAQIWPGLEPLRQALGLDSLLGRWIGDCSTGMRQRVAIALAFVGGHKLVILDEPFNWLDPVAIFDLRQALRSMVDDGLTLMTALHDLGTLVISCDAGVMLADGRVVMALDSDMLQHAAQNLQTFERQTIDLLRSGCGPRSF